MKAFIKSIIFGVTLALGANGLLFVQPSNSWAEQSYRAKFGRPSTMEEKTVGVTDAQRMALAKCMEATEQVLMQASQMQTMGRPFRGRISYSRNDLVILSDYREELNQALTNLTAVHLEFLKGLSEAQEKRLDQRLRKLDHLQAELSSRMSEIDHDFLKAEPGPDSSGFAWDLSALKRAADKWLSEHRKIEKEMGFGPDRSSIDQSPRSTQCDLSYARHTGKGDTDYIQGR